MGVNSFAKRKATIQRESLQDSGEALKEKEEGLQPRKLISKLLLLERQTSPLIRTTPAGRKNLRLQGSRRVKEARLSGSRARKLQRQEGELLLKLQIQTLAQENTRFSPLGSHGQLALLSGGEGWARTLPSWKQWRDSWLTGGRS